MKNPIRIAFAEDEPDMREYLEKTLPLLGHQVVVSAKNGRELVEKCRTAKPDLIISDIKMPDIDGIDAARTIFQERPVPVILLSAHSEPELIARADNDYVFAYLVKPIKETDLNPAIGLAMKRFEQLQALRKEASDLRQALEDRKLIERAKGVLMKRAHIGEHDAFRRMQKLASSKRQKLVEIAQMILAVEEVSGSDDGESQP
ncbi:MAG TPA: response regulator [Gemmataceae bacterium]|nr:response regulator [Gemmataceae bacterium]